MFALAMPITEKVLRTVLVYLGIALLIRVAGKRLMAQMNSLDLVVVLLLSNVVQNAIIGNDNSLSGGLMGAVVLVLFNAVLDRASLRWPWVRWVLEGRSTEVVLHGAIIPGALSRLGLDREEVTTALRHQGGAELSDVERASMHPGGTLDLTLRPEHEPLDKADLAELMISLKALLEERGATGTSGRRNGSSPDQSQAAQ